MNKAEYEEAIKEMRHTSQFYSSDKNFKIAIEAIERQIPKKFNRSHIYDETEKDYIFDGYRCICPSCGFSFITLNKGQEHCHKCGQSLDWSDKNE
jgi:predicted nucleic acid-binding Zn finger protein